MNEDVRLLCSSHTLLRCWKKHCFYLVIDSFVPKGFSKCFLLKKKEKKNFPAKWIFFDDFFFKKKVQNLHFPVDSRGIHYIKYDNKTWCLLQWVEVRHCLVIIGRHNWYYLGYSGMIYWYSCSEFHWLNYCTSIFLNS